MCTFLMGPQNHSCCPVHPRKWQENSSILHNHSSVSPDYCTNQPAPVLCIQKQIPVSVAILKENTVYCLGTSRAVPEEQLMAVAVRSEHLLFLLAISLASSFQTQLLLTPRYITDLDPFFCDTEKWLKSVKEEKQKDSQSVHWPPSGAALGASRVTSQELQAQCSTSQQTKASIQSFSHFPHSGDKCCRKVATCWRDWVYFHLCQATKQTLPI